MNCFSSTELSFVNEPIKMSQQSNPVNIHINLKVNIYFSYHEQFGEQKFIIVSDLTCLNLQYRFQDERPRIRRCRSRRKISADRFGHQGGIM